MKILQEKKSIDGVSKEYNYAIGIILTIVFGFLLFFQLDNFIFTQSPFQEFLLQ
jgi:hypothetical protein